MCGWACRWCAVGDKQNSKAQFNDMVVVTLKIYSGIGGGLNLSVRLILRGELTVSPSHHGGNPAEVVSLCVPRFQVRHLLVVSLL